MNLGFSYVGLIYLLMLMIPNLLWTKHRPKDYERYAEKENRLLLCFERVGEVLVTCTALIFSDFNIDGKAGLPGWSAWLILSFFLMLLYEVFWIRYFKSRQTMRDFYSSLLGIPVAGATLPVAAFLLLAVYGKNILLAIAVLILGIGHIGIHLTHRSEIADAG